MKIVITSLGPVFPDAFHGGSGRVLVDLAKSLGDAGHDVEIFCTQRKDNYREFLLHPRVKVSPTLRFKETYPEPFYVPPYQLAEIVGRLRSAIEEADVVYVHDGELPFHFLYDDIPTVISFQDFVYPDTLSNAMSFARDALIVASEYVAGCVRDSIGQYRRDIESITHVIPNGINLDEFRRKAPLQWQANLKNRGYYLVGCPHRPDPSKGLSESLQLIALLKSKEIRNGLKPLLLIPRWIDSRINTDDGHIYRTLYDDLITEAEAIGVRENIQIHDWLNANEVPQYYAGCDIVLAIGSFVEAFGNVPVEAAACGKPSVVAGIGGHVGKLPGTICEEVPPGSVSTACDSVIRLLDTQFDYDAIREEIEAKYSLSKMTNGYRKIIENTRLRTPLPLREQVSGISIKIPAWCRFFGEALYNDYSASFLRDPELFRIFGRSGGVVQIQNARVTQEKLNEWIREGYVVAYE